VSRDGVKSGGGDSAASGAERDVIDRYRKASGELDERPSAAARASILAAASREVGAKPVDAATPYRAGRRWPLAAAAAVMLSTLAVMMAIRTNEEMPQFSDSSAPSRSATDNVIPPAAPVPTAPTAPTAPAAPTTPMAEKSISAKPETKDAQAVDRSPARAQENFGGRLRKESDSVAQAPREESRPVVREAPATAPASELDRMRQNAPAAVTVPPPPPEPTERPKLRAEQGAAAGAAAPTAPTDQASGDARRDVAKSAASPPLAAAQSERKQADESAAIWLERIIKLRREGRHEDADAELKRFRERYPQVQPPAEALPPTGTR
jgi:hypothetical protein